MKQRIGFVSNSSSSSFVLDMDKLTAGQVYIIENHWDYAEKNFPDLIYGDEEDNSWNCTRDDNTLVLNTWMDNFDMADFLKRIGVEDDAIVRRDD